MLIPRLSNHFRILPAQVTIYSYVHVTSEELGTEQLVKTLLFCLISMTVAPEVPTVLEPSFAEHPVKVTVPKSAKETKELPSS